jgi:hypothetical protein
MSSLAIASLCTACVFGGALLGSGLGRILPTHHLNELSRDSIKLGAGMISLMAALVLGLLVSSAKSTFDATSAAITEGGAKLIVLDRVLAHYGAEAAAIRQDLRHAVVVNIETLWPEEHPTASGLDAFERTNAVEAMLDAMRSLQPQNETQRALQAQALEIGNDLLLRRWLQIERTHTSPPALFLYVLLFWLTMLYVSFGMIAPRNLTVLVVLFIGALSVATAVFLILEMNHPLHGLIKITSGPMRTALEHLGE